MATSSTFNRRRHERFVLMPMYTSVTAQRAGEPADTAQSGHAYDISESGARIEFDDVFAAGDQLDVHFSVSGQELDFAAQASVVRCFDADDDPGPRRIAVEFKSFAHADDRRRLIRWLGGGHLQRAA